MKINFEDILRKSQRELKLSLHGELINLGYKPISRKGFIYGKGELPVLLVAHLDTVHREKVKNICYSRDGKIVMSPEGIGGDDRAGVYMVLKTAQTSKCHVLFCEDEEKGGLGAHKFLKSGINPLDINYIIEFDRKGKKDAVFYDCVNPDFTKFICSFGLREAYGSFSDISVIAPALGVAAVNISSGYYNEHSKHEYINVSHMNRNIEIAKSIINTVSPRYEYIDGYDFYNYDKHDCRFIYDDCSGCMSCYTLMETMIMPVPENAYIKRGLNLYESDGFFIDEKGRVYEYTDDFEAVVLVDYEAVTVNGLPLRYNRAKAHYYEVFIQE